MNDEQVVPSSGNVFEDIGLPDAEDLSIKAQLVINLKRLMKLHKLTQKEVAESVRADQPTISKVLRGHLTLVTVDRLLQWHSALGQEIQINIRHRFARHAGQIAEPGKISVFTCSCSL